MLKAVKEKQHITCRIPILIWKHEGHEKMSRYGLSIGEKNTCKSAAKPIFDDAIAQKGKIRHPQIK